MDNNEDGINYSRMSYSEYERFCARDRHHAEYFWAFVLVIVFVVVISAVTR